MRMEQANAIAITEILSIIGLRNFKKIDNKVLYPTLKGNPSCQLQVDVVTNTWVDSGIGKSGNTVDFVCAYLEVQGEDHMPKDAIRWLSNMVSCEAECPELSEDDPTFPNGNFVVHRTSTLHDGMHTSYLHWRGVPHALAKRYLKDVRVSNFTTGKEFSALGMVNENGGYHLVNRKFKGAVAPKGVSVIRGSVVLPPEVHVFKNFMDFLSALASEGKTQFEGDAIILHSLTNISHAFPYIRGYTYKTLYSWLDNTSASQKATEILNAVCARESNKIHCKAMNSKYLEFRDISSWHRFKLGLKP